MTEDLPEPTPTERHLDRLRRLGRWAESYVVDDGGVRMNPAAEIAWAINRIERLERIARFSQGVMGDVEDLVNQATNMRLTFNRLQHQMEGVWEE